MSKIIVEFDASIDVPTAITLVQKVIQQGLISTSRAGKCYCFLTTFHGGHRVFSDLTKKGTYTFGVSKHEDKIRGKTAHTIITDDLVGK